MLIQSNASVECEVNVVKKDVADLRKKEKEEKKAAMEIEENGEAAQNGESEEQALTDEVQQGIDEVAQLTLESYEDYSVETDDDENENVNNKNRRGIGMGFGYGGGGLFGNRFGGGLFGQAQAPVAAASGPLPEGKFSVFCAAIKKNYQGVAYLMLQNGYDLMNAVEVKITKFIYFTD